MGSAFPQFKGFNDNTNPMAGTLGGFTFAGLKPMSTYSTGGGARRPVNIGGMGQYPGAKSGNPIMNLTQSLGQFAKTLPGQEVGYKYGNNPGPIIGAPGANVSMRDLYAGSLLKDLGSTQQAEQMNRQEGRGIAQEFDARGQEMGGRIRAAGEKGAQELGEGGDRMVGEIRDRGTGMVDEIRKRIDMTEKGYQDRSAQDIESQTLGMSQAGQNSISQRLDDLERSGASPEEKDAVRQQMTQEYAQQRNQVVQQATGKFNDAMSQLRTAGTQVLAGTEGDALGQLNQAHQASMAFHQAGAALRLQAETEADGMELQGMQQAAQWVRENPYSPVSLASVVAAMMGVGESGAGQYGNMFQGDFVGAVGGG